MTRGAVATVLGHLHGLIGPPPDEESTDRQLLERFVAGGDEAAFALLVGRHGRLVYNLGLRILRNAADAEDAFQATFLVLARKAAAIRNRDALASWLYGVAFRISVRAKAQAPRHEPSLGEEADMAQPDPANQAAWRELQPLLDHELDRLPEKFKILLLLCYFEGKSNEEAARQLGWPSGTVKGRLARARELLRQRLGRRGLTLSIGTVIGFLSQEAMAAPLPSRLVRSTISATAQVVAGTATPAGTVSARTVALTKGELHSMFIAKLRIMTAVAVVASVGAWASVAGYQAWAERPSAAAVSAFLDEPEANAEQNAAKPAAADPAKQEGFEGRWTAKIEVGDKSLLVRIELQKDDKSQWKGVVRLGKDKDFELMKIKIAGNKIAFDVDAVEASLSFVGELKDETVTGSVELLDKETGLKQGNWTMTRR